MRKLVFRAVFAVCFLLGFAWQANATEGVAPDAPQNPPYLLLDVEGQLNAYCDWEVPNAQAAQLGEDLWGCVGDMEIVPVNLDDLCFFTFSSGEWPIATTNYRGQWVCASRHFWAQQAHIRNR